MTRIFKNAEEMYEEIERTLFEMGTVVQSHTVQDQEVEGNPQFDTIELMGFDYKLTDWGDIDKVLLGQEKSLMWAEAELRERTGLQINPGTAWEYRSHIWKQYIHNGKFAYTYPERLYPNLKMAAIELCRHPRSRQVVVPIYDRQIDPPRWGKERVPCSLFYQFILREGKLNLIYVMRSCDFVTHFMYDVWEAVRILEFVGLTTEMPVGTFHHFISSLHAFRKDLPEGIF